jgi:ketosteroid isomerase-like protein
MYQFRPLWFAIGTLIAAAPCCLRPATAQQRVLSPAQYAAERGRLLAADSAHARATRAQGLVPGFVSVLTENAVYLEPGSDHIHGKARIEAFLSAQVPGRTLGFHPGIAELSADGSVGYTVGWTTLTDSGSSSPSVQYGKYLAFWRRQTDGTWRVEAWNRSRATEPPASSPLLPAQQRVVGNPAQPIDPAAAAREARSADSAFAALSVAQGTATAFYQYAAPQALTLGGGKEFVVGREAIREDQAANSAPGQTLDWKPVAGEAGPRGDLAWTVGEFRYTAPQDGKTLTVTGKYLTIWIRTADGAWRYVADGGSGSVPPK